ncbi:hypothetical protein [Ignavigranum ruoffiae]|uniref:hypothetical protein n=1 Tax=Ignavigranum ruoffiae TaxID=89093 RepID=UPI0023534B2B|nr:hypothetical protein [Ignavigranum ruoffiae]
MNSVKLETNVAEYVELLQKCSAVAKELDKLVNELNEFELICEALEVTNHNVKGGD